MLLKVATGNSRLSLIQTELVCERLRQAIPDLKIEKTELPQADASHQKGTLSYVLSRKSFTQGESERAILEGRVDFAVCPFREISNFDQAALVIAGVHERGSPMDVLVSRKDRGLKELKTKTVVGTSNYLQASQLKRARPDLRTGQVLGPVEGLVERLDKGEFDAVIVAESVLARLGMTPRIAERFSLEDFVPVPGQGMIVAVAKKDDHRTIGMLRRIDHSPTRVEAETELELVRQVRECRVPLGALASASGGNVQLTARVLSMEGKEMLQATRSGSILNPLELAKTVGEELLAQGAKKLQEGWSKVYHEGPFS